MKKVIIIVIAAIIILAGGGFFFFRMKLFDMYEEVCREYDKTPEIDITAVSDGTYSAKWGKFVVNADLDVVVKGGKIEKINMKKMECGEGYEGLETIDRIVKNQKVKVDSVTGATTSSKVIMITTAKALQNR